MKKWMVKLLVVMILVLVVTPQKNILAVEDISSTCGILMEQTTGRVLFDKCGDEQLYIASTTKILTAILAIENANLDDWVEITQEDTHQVGSSLYLSVGDQVRLRDLLYGLMLRSGNDSAWAIARYVGDDVANFVVLMNEKAQALGMESSSFQNPSGLDETTYNLSTAYDMALLQRYAMNNPIFREIAGTNVYRATTQQGKNYTWRNKHRLINGRYEYTIAGKTGFTKQARRTLVSSANNGDLELIAVTLRGGDDWHDHIRMLEYGFHNFDLRQVTDIGELQLLEQEIFELTGLERLFVREARSIVVRNDGSENVRKHLVLSTDETSLAVGTLEILVNDVVVDTIAVYQFAELSVGSWWERLLNWIVGH